ncbi:M48 family metallopeptidase, partial [Acidobacteria bacterium AH-259-D05]|nr:M48 family metallopeptidase [Acidobacteria bacterium AH-259-D05]
MKYTPKALTENVNVSKTHPLKEFLLLTGGILGALIFLYLILGLALELVVIPRMPYGLERSLGKLFLENYQVEQTAQTQYLQTLLDRMVENLPPQHLEFQVHTKDNPTVNAMALPGGHIVFYEGMLDQVESENELAMILGHELGHFAKRHHLRGLGRGLVFLFLSAIILGEQNGITQFLQDTLGKVESKFSQKQEREVDEFALHLLHKTYGHVAGATDFFERVQKENSRSNLEYFFASHPSPTNRVSHLEELIENFQYPIQ